ncbi:DoxX family protein [Xanthocytophaga agilis]|uniref:DoxX family protein n=1 Tax=Xanthocytophaga agilis TaxID=3048010 RepID=A0AAE3UI43_9BACT|nr:DoxX family protein [Xanthocytophaga agilis]MDJ1506115.1 DoxX family protein [Xanthocytophaga agilis]
MIDKILFTLKKNHYTWSPFFLRLIIGFGFITHGWAKLSRGPEGFGKLLTQIHIPFPEAIAWICTMLELSGGVAIVLGVFVSIAAIPLIGIMLVAMFSIHIHYGFSSVKTIGLTPQGPVFGPIGYEINLLYIVGLVSLILTGAGIFSVDAWLARAKNKSIKEPAC